MLRHPFFHGLIFFLFLLSAVGSGAPAGKKERHSYPVSSVDWAEEVRFVFQETPLYDALSAFARSEGFTLFLDRRVDTEIPVTLSIDSMSLLTAMTELTRSAGLDAVRVGRSILYVGPAGSGGELLLLIASHRGDFFALESGYVSSKNEDFVIPSNMLEEAANQVGLTWSGLDRMPFDCWHADALASLSYRELFSLVLIGYGVDYQVGGTPEKPTLKPVKIDRTSSITRQWSADDTTGLDFNSYADVVVSGIRNEVRVTGSFSSVAELEYLVAQNRAKKEIEMKRSARTEGSKISQSEGIRTVTGEVRQTTLSSLFDKLHRDLGVKIQLDSSLDGTGITMQTRISCRFNQANARQAVKIIAEELHTDFQFDGDTAVLCK